MIAFLSIPSRTLPAGDDFECRDWKVHRRECFALWYHAKPLREKCIVAGIFSPAGSHRIGPIYQVVLVEGTQEHGHSQLRLNRLTGRHGRGGR
jgi:hypothetical protein